MIFLQRKKLLLLVALAILVASIGLYFFITPEYEAQAVINVLPISSAKLAKNPRSFLLEMQRKYVWPQEHAYIKDSGARVLKIDYLDKRIPELILIQVRGRSKAETLNLTQKIKSEALTEISAAVASMHEFYTATIKQSRSRVAQLDQAVKEVDNTLSSNNLSFETSALFMAKRADLLTLLDRKEKTINALETEFVSLNAAKPFIVSNATYLNNGLPVKPNLTFHILIGLVLGVFAGILAVILFELSALIRNKS